MGRGHWFRHKSIGYGVTPASWQGWLCTLVLIVVVVATMLLLGDPPGASPDSARRALQIRAELGFGGLHIPFLGRLALVALEAVVFLLLARSRTAPDPD